MARGSTQLQEGQGSIPPLLTGGVPSSAVVACISMAEVLRTRVRPSLLHRAGLPALLSACLVLAMSCSRTSVPPSSPAVSPPSPTVAVPIHITIGGKPFEVAPGSSVGAVLQQTGVKLVNGQLLDVQGGSLQANADPGKIKVNGRNANRNTHLAEGDQVQLVNGRDHTEDVTVDRVKFDGERQLNPQNVLGTAPGYMVTTTGKISGKVGSIVFQPSNRVNPPKSVALTFDDGPGIYTHKVLKILKKAHVPATFFVVGYLVERYPDIVKDEVRLGNSVGNHSWSHPLTIPFAQMDQKQLDNQIERTNDALAALGIKPNLFRPPGGSYDANVVETARRNGARTVLWDISTDDWASATTPKDIVQRIMSQIQPGSIILMHDGGGDQSATVKALPTLIKQIRKRGYGFQRLV